MESYKRYAKLRTRCLLFWNLHPDASGSVGDLWHRTSRTLTETSAPSLFGDAADLIDIQRRELEAARSVIKALMPKLHVEGLSVDEVIAGEMRSSELSSPSAAGEGKEIK